MRPRPGALVESSSRSGLSHTSVSSRLSNHEPLYADAQHVAAVRPLGADGEVVRARVVGQRHLDVVAKPKLAPHGSSPTCRCRRERRRHVEVRRRRRQQAHVADVAPLAQVELRGDRHVRGQVSPAPFWIARCVASSSSSGLVRRRVRRLRIDAVELRNLVPQAGDDEAARSARSRPKYR